MSQGRPRGGTAEAALTFLILGTVAFGGPAAHVALMRRELVVKRHWLPEAEFMRMFAACNLIPGPSSTELAIYLGYRRAGWRGLVLGGFLFILPAMLIMLAIASAYRRFGSSVQAGGILYGIRAAVVGIVVWAIADLGRRLVKRWPLFVLAAVITVLSLLGINPAVLILAGGLVSAGAATARRSSWGGAGGSALLLASGAWLPSWTGAKLVVLFFTFVKIGVVTFGSGYVLFAFLHADFVQSLHWLTDKQLVDAVAIGQATPGPLFTTATFLGYLFAGVPGALLASLAIFLPGFVLVPLLDRVVRLTERSVWVQSFVDGANAAALGLIAAVTLQVGRVSLVDPLSVVIAGAALAAVLRWPLSSPLVVVAAGLTGLARLVLL